MGTVFAGSRLYLELIAENVGLAVANLQLREKADGPFGEGSPHRAIQPALPERHPAAARHGPDQSAACLSDDRHRFFKRFNDEFGHDAGDLVMQYVGRILRDTIGSMGSAFRFGGEEFTILLPGRSEGEGLELAEALRQKIGSAALSHDGRMLGTVTVSLGVAGSPQEGSIETLVRRADAALLKAKAQGRNRALTASNIIVNGLVS
jgi:diguanylate cyclase (GGDEF)-like protein